MKRCRVFPILLVFSLAALCPATPPGSPPSRPVGSTFAPPTRGEQTLAAGKVARGEERNQYRQERAVLFQAFLDADRGDEEMDVVLMRLADFTPTQEEMRDEILSRCDDDQLVRLVERGKMAKEFDKVALFGGELLRRSPHDPRVPKVKFDTAFARMLVDGDEKEALRMWKDLEVEDSTGPNGLRASVYREAVEGPVSIAAMEAAYQIGAYQYRVVGNYYRGWFSDGRVIEASERPFFREFLKHPEIPVADKAEVLYKVLFSRYMSGQYDRVAEFTNEIFGLAGFDSGVSEKTALMIGLSYRMRHMAAEAIPEFENFVRAYPNSLRAPDVGLYLAYSHQELGRMQDALIHYRLVFDLYPNTEAAATAKRSYEMFLDHDRTGAWLAEVERRLPTVLASLREPLDPKVAWGSGEKPLKMAAVDAHTPPPTPANHPRFARLKDLSLASKP